MISNIKFHIVSDKTISAVYIKKDILKNRMRDYDFNTISGEKVDVFYSPKEAYTKKLLDSVPVPDPDLEHEKYNKRRLANQAKKSL